jgi:hypothetical protein
LTQWLCRECDSLSLPHYFKKRDGSEYFAGWRCVNCGFIDPPAIGQMKVKDREVRR